MIDWMEALRVGGFGFLTVFAVLIILAVALWLQSNILYRILHRKEQKKQEKES
jgi:Na+-transporting methylmalonyl-CoA/oxaloacetate decarboxylase gamma subunit